MPGMALFHLNFQHENNRFMPWHQNLAPFRSQNEKPESQVVRLCKLGQTDMSAIFKACSSIIVIIVKQKSQCFFPIKCHLDKRQLKRKLWSFPSPCPVQAWARSQGPQTAWSFWRWRCHCWWFCVPAKSATCWPRYARPSYRTSSLHHMAVALIFH